MITRRSVMEMMAVAGAVAPATADMISSGVTPDKLGALSALDVIPPNLREAVIAHRPTADLAPYLNRAVRKIDAAGGGTLYFPHGSYNLSSLDLTQQAFSENGLTLVGAGREQSILRPAVAGQAVIDASGRNNLNLRDLQIQSLDHVSACGLLLARLEQKPQCLRNRIENVRIRGSFALAAAVSASGESNSWIGCLLENSYPDSRHCCFLTTNGLAALRGLTQPARGRRIDGPNTDNVMTDCEFYAPFPTATLVRFIGSAGYTMLGCSVIAGGVSRARLVAYEAAQSIFDGPVTWHSPHFEVFGEDNVAHHLRGAGTCFYNGINTYSGNYQLSTSTLLLGNAGDAGLKPVLQNSTWTAPKLAQGMKNLRISVFAVTDSDLSLNTDGEATEIEVGGFVANCRLKAAKLSLKQRVATSGTCV